ncbi:hypothetical protein ES332_D12G155000v1 [Gossypium tomentosum]|uniref:valine--tRNA ligase n=1 Tax=Gossypium tomentosum TaxID=34277 RepID=A0A5D2I9G4_GOSTO|nr:hypothetical protein ES332_D12G155000v1 [Gossypium tomentosum]
MLVSEGIKRVELGRDEFEKRVWEWKEKYGGTITNQIKRLGASCDWTRECFTLDEQSCYRGIYYTSRKMINFSRFLT